MTILEFLEMLRAMCHVGQTNQALDVSAAKPARAGVPFPSSVRVNLCY